MLKTLWSSQKEKRREYSRFLLAFVFLGFLMKIAGELIHEMGHSLMVIIFGGRVQNIMISVEWPFTPSYTIWELSNPTNFQLASIAVGGILFDIVTTVMGQSILILNKNMRPLTTLSIFWLSFWSYLNAVVYMVMGAFHPFGDILDLINAIQVSRFLIGTLGFLALIVFTYSLSLILRNIFLSILKLDRASEMVSIFWALLHLFFVSITVINYGLPIPPVIAGVVLVLIFTWSYISGRWFMVFFSQLKDFNINQRISGSKKPLILSPNINEDKGSRNIKIVYAFLILAALISAVLTGLIINQYVSAYRLIINTEIEVEATNILLDFEKPELNLSVSVYNPTSKDLTLKRIEFDVKLNDKYMTHETLSNIPTASPLNEIMFTRVLILPLERDFTLKEALEKGEWEWAIQGTGYIDTMFGETLLRFSFKSTIEPK